MKCKSGMQSAETSNYDFGLVWQHAPDGKCHIRHGGCLLTIKHDNVGLQPYPKSLVHTSILFLYFIEDQ